MMKQVTKDELKKKTNEFSIETIFTLSLANHGIYDLGCLGSCVNLVHLDLSKNNLSSVMILRSLTLLQILDLSENRLSALSGMENLESLECLNVAGNFLNTLDSLLPLTKLEKLSILVLQDTQKNVSNPVIESIAKREDCTKKVKSILPSLTCLDGAILSNEGAEVNEIFGTMETKSPHEWKKYLASFSIPQTHLINDPPFVRIGFEKNPTYEAAKDLSKDCERIAIEATDILKNMREENL